ncbi:hypothetical protein K440DRAFT_657280 [Wilcoxina mikolae CBS 423.85]|nr:hypothetical protein K440DRAFT_657280 [Wilcoxina mikolae CBS 423.85]
MEPLAAIGLVGNIVQFVDFTSKILSKTQQIYRSADGALSENIDTELVTNDLAKLSAGLRACGDPALEKLSAASESEWKEGKMEECGKALRAVWSKEEIDDIQKKLSSFRDEMNLHIVVDLRGRIDLLSLQQSDRFDLLDENTKAVIDAVINSRDVFEHFLVVHVEELLKAQEQTETTVRAMHKHTDIRLREEHDVTRTEILGEVQLAITENREAYKIHTQQIEHLQKGIYQLQEELRQRDAEYKALLTEFFKANSPKKRKSLQKRGNAVSATIFDLQTLNESLQSQAKNALRTLKINEIWRITAYLTPTSHRTTRIYQTPSGGDLVLCYYSYYYIPEFCQNIVFKNDMHIRWQIPPDSQITAAGGSSHSPLNGPQLISLVNKIRTEDTMAYNFVWSMAVLAAIIVEYVPSGINQFHMASQVLASTSNHTIMSQCSALGTRLQFDLEVWKSIAQVTGLQKEIARLIMARPWEKVIGVSQWQFGSEPLEQAEMKEMVRFLRWMWFKTEPAEGGKQTQETWADPTFVIRHKAVYVVAYSLKNIGMDINLLGIPGSNWVLIESNIDSYCRAMNRVHNHWLPLLEEPSIIFRTPPVTITRAAPTRAAPTRAPLTRTSHTRASHTRRFNTHDPYTSVSGTCVHSDFYDMCEVWPLFEESSVISARTFHFSTSYTSVSHARADADFRIMCNTWLPLIEDPLISVPRTTPARAAPTRAAPPRAYGAPTRVAPARAPAARVIPVPVTEPTVHRAPVSI